jgi:diguanylate cyclase (GGDEF)-like protein
MDRRGVVIQPDTGQQLERDTHCSGCGQRLDTVAVDKLAGLLDRLGWDERAEWALSRAGGRATALLLVELDGLARITEQLGHTAGRLVLRAAASVMRKALRATDLAGRYGGPGGDEFLVLLPARDRQLGELIARRIRSRIRRAIIPVRSAVGEPVVVSDLATSIGLAVNDPTTARRHTLMELVRQADAALLQAKSRGGNQIVVAGVRIQSAEFQAEAAGDAHAGGGHALV